LLFQDYNKSFLKSRLYSQLTPEEQHQLKTFNRAVDSAAILMSQEQIMLKESSSSSSNKRRRFNKPHHQ